MPDGWILDVYPDPQKREMVVWLKTTGGAAVKLAEPFTPVVYARSRSEEALRELGHALSLMRGVGPTSLERRLCGLEEEESPVLRVPVLDHSLVNRLAQTIDARGGYRDLEVFDADLRMTHRYLLAKHLWPFAKVRAWAPGKYRLLEADRHAFEYETPPLRALELHALPDVGRGEVPTHEHRVARAWVEGVDTTGARWTPRPESRVEWDGAEADILRALHEEVRRRDPDVVLTRTGDSFLLAYLQARAHANDVELTLGREPDPTRARKAAKSYFSYGKIKYQAPAWALHGRIHVDRASSFFYTEAGFFGLLDLARVSNVPLQDVARLGAGTALTAIQIDLAASQGRLIPWKKNVPEATKTARQLLVADRGGYIFEPRVGLHEDVVEYDFASLYPNIMVKHNISPEAVLCACCRPEELPAANVTPQLATWTCGRRKAFIPTYLEPIIRRRERFKRKRKEDPERRAQYQEVCDVYKWLLVTSFGYQGYKNAKFGRIECHEAISAWARETLLGASEIARDHGFELLHGIVDSLWLRRFVPGADHRTMGEAVSGELAIPFEFQGRYKWIVFLPNRSGIDRDAPPVGALNRYYGCFDAPPDKPARSQAGQPLDYIAGGAMKVRGVEIRQHSTPRVVRRAQELYLQEVAQADDAQGFLRRLPGAVDAVKPHLRSVLDGEVPLEDLVFTAAVSREAAQYRVLTGPSAAVKQLAARGIRVPPGDVVHYVITDEAARDPERKVVEARLMKGHEAYDREAYARVVVRSIASLTLPFGLAESDIEDRLLERGQVRLSRFDASRLVAAQLVG